MSATLVSAGAGAGKTHWIVEHVVQRVAAGVPLDRVAAVTFTDAAAAELSDRIRARLLERGLDVEAARVDAAAVCTIHRFALALLQRYPLAAGLPPEPLVLEESQSATLLARCAAELLRSADGDAVSELRALLGVGLGPGLGLAERGYDESETPTGRLMDLAGRVIEKARSVGMRPDALRACAARAADELDAALGRAGDPRALEHALERALEATFAFMADHPTAPTKTDERAYRALAPLLDRAADVTLVDAAVRVATLPASAFSKTFKPGAELHAAASRLVAEHPEVRARLALCVRGVIDAAARVLALFAQRKQRIGAVDFEDMQVAALDLLTGRGGGAPPYAPLVAQTFRLIVVDEFQDTSPLQFRIFETLREHGAEVAYVGDLKQAIYGFRSADSQLFAALLDDGEARGRAHKRLATSRRSRPELVAFANDLFGALMRAPGARFEPLEADNAYTAGRCPKTAPCVDVVRHPLTEQGASRGAREHGVIARLRALVGDAGLTVIDRATGEPRPARWGDVAILARRNAALSQWASALRARGIAAVLEEGALFDALEVRLAVAWLRMLATGRDTASAAAVLVSEMYGVSQRTMARMTLAGVVGSPGRALELAARDPDALPLTPYERRALARCAEDLAHARRALRYLPLPEAVEIALERVDLALRLATREAPPDAARIAANLRRISEVAHALAAKTERPLELDGATGATLENLLGELERLREAGATQRAGDESPDAVRLVTIHGAKGLEYPIVVLDALAESLDLRLPRVEVARPGDRASILSADLLAKSAVRVVPDVGPRALQDALARSFDSEAAQRDEWLRLLYVAVTRAREHLVLLWPEDAKSASATRRVKDLLTDAIAPPPSAGGEVAWSLRPGERAHRATVVSAAAPPPAAAAGAAAGGDPRAAEALAQLRALVESDAPRAAAAASTAPAADHDARAEPSLAFVSPTELCLVADCPEVPRLAALYPREHRVARLVADGCDVAMISSARIERLAIRDELDPTELGELLHAAVERAELLAHDAAADANVRALLARRGTTDDAVASFVAAAVRAVRDALAILAARELVGREVPFAVAVGPTTVRGAIDLVVRAPDGLHVIDLKTHVADAGTAPRHVAYYRPQLDAYALALARLTGERVAGRHLVLPAAGMLASVRGAFDPDAAAARLGALASLLAREAPGPGPAPENDCARCAWRPLCRVARASD